MSAVVQSMLKRAVALLLSAAMIVTVTPTRVFADESVRGVMGGEWREQPVSVTMTDYIAIDNDYIACYVDKNTGAFAVLPSNRGIGAVDASYATFLIDGRPYVFGQDYEGAGTSLSEPVINDDGNNIAVTWKILDYEITQYTAITQELSYDDSYAAFLRYNVCYFGQGESSIAARVLLDTLFGADDTLPVTTSESLTYFMTETKLTDIPADFRVTPEFGSTANAFVTLDDGNVTKPEAVVFAKMSGIKTAAYDYAVSEDEYFSGDSAAALYYPSVALGGSDEERYATISVLYGFYGLEKNDVEEDEQPDEDTAAITPLSSVVPLGTLLGGSNILYAHSVTYVDSSGTEHPEYADYFRDEWVMRYEDDIAIGGSWIAQIDLDLYYTEKNVDKSTNRPIYEIVKITDPDWVQGGQRGFAEERPYYPLKDDNMLFSSRRTAAGRWAFDARPAVLPEYNYVVTVAPAHKLELELACGYGDAEETFFFDWVDVKNMGSGFFVAEGSEIMVEYYGKLAPGITNDFLRGIRLPADGDITLNGAPVAFVMMTDNSANPGYADGGYYRFTIPSVDEVSRLSATTDKNGDYNLWYKAPKGVTVDFSPNPAKAAAGTVVTATVKGSVSGSSEPTRRLQTTTSPPRLQTAGSRCRS